MAMPCALQPADQLEQRAARRRAPRLLVGSSRTSTRQPMASARAISTSCCAAGDRSPTIASGGMSWWPSSRERRHAPSARHRDRAARRRGAPARRRARCSPSRSGAARARAPGRSSRRRRGAPSSGSRGAYGAPSSGIAPASGFSAPARIAISVLLPAPFWPTSAHTSPPRTAKSTPSSATVAPNALRTPRISKRGGRALTCFSHRDRSGLQQLLRVGIVHRARA